MPKAVEDDRAKLAAAKTAEEKAYYERRIAQTRDFLSEMRGLLDRAAGHHLPGQPGAARQGATTCIWRFEGAGTRLATLSCSARKEGHRERRLAHGFLPYVGDGYPREWARTLKSVGEFEFEQIIGATGGAARTGQDGADDGLHRRAGGRIETGKRRGPRRGGVAAGHHSGYVEVAPARRVRGVRFGFAAALRRVPPSTTPAKFWLTASRKTWRSTYRDSGEDVAGMAGTKVDSEAQVVNRDELVPLYRVVLLDDDVHTYDYVIEMLQRLFLLSTVDAFRHAVEVDSTGRTLVITCELPQAEFARDQIQGYGPDWRMAQSKGSMAAVVEPAAASRCGGVALAQHVNDAVASDAAREDYQAGVGGR